MINELRHKEVLGAEWGAAGKTLPNGGLPFLTRNAVAESCNLAGFEAEAIPYLQAAADGIEKQPDLRRLAWRCHSLLCRSPADLRDDVRNWEALTDLLGECAGSFYLLIALSGVPRTRAFHQSRYIPEQVARDTYSDTSLWARGYKAKHGVWGLDLWILPWLFNHLSGELYRLGRLQFIQRPFRQKLHAFRNRASREVTVLAGDGIQYRGDGQLDGTGGEFDTETGWTSRLIVDSERAVGTPIHPTGIAVQPEGVYRWMAGSAFSLPAIRFWKFISPPGARWVLMNAVIRCVKRLISFHAISQIDRFRGSAVLPGC